jgi:hypothetical protein
MVYIQYRELMGDTILNFPAAEQSAVQPPEPFIDGNESKHLRHCVLICINIAGFRFQVMGSIIIRITETSESAYPTGTAQWLQQ